MDLSDSPGLFQPLERSHPLSLSPFLTQRTSIPMERNIEYNTPDPLAPKLLFVNDPWKPTLINRSNILLNVSYWYIPETSSWLVGPKGR